LVLEPPKICIIFKKLDEKIKEVLLKKNQEKKMQFDKLILGSISKKYTRKRWKYRFYEKKEKGDHESNIVEKKE
jgi:hypothetical protein